MKIDTPWSTDIIDKLGLDPTHRFLLKLWIWMDRAMWICVTVVAYWSIQWLRSV